MRRRSASACPEAPAPGLSQGLSCGLSPGPVKAPLTRIGERLAARLTRIDFASLLPRVKACDSGLIGATKTQKHEDPPSGRAGVPANRGAISIWRARYSLKN